MNTQPYALWIKGPRADCFDMADTLGMDSDMVALSVSIFEINNTEMSVQALFETKAQAQTCLENLEIPENMTGFIEQLNDENWVVLSQQGLPPVPIGRFFLYGSHDADNIPKSAEIPILIDAGMAFGTGHHSTTAGCLELFDHLLNVGNLSRQHSPQTILDLGCGAGTLAIAAAKVFNREILATDIDPDAVETCAVNAAQNGVGNYVRAITANGFEHSALKGQTFDLIFANILAGPLIELAPDIAIATRSGGYVILAGIQDMRAAAIDTAFTTAGFTLTPYPHGDGWTHFIAHKQ